MVSWSLEEPLVTVQRTTLFKSYSTSAPFLVTIFILKMTLLRRVIRSGLEGHRQCRSAEAAVLVNFTNISKVASRVQIIHILKEGRSLDGRTALDWSRTTILKERIDSKEIAVIRKESGDIRINVSILIHFRLTEDFTEGMLKHCRLEGPEAKKRHTRGTSSQLMI